MTRIEKEAERRLINEKAEEVFFMKANMEFFNSLAVSEKKIINQAMIEMYDIGATSEQLRSEKLVEAQDEYIKFLVKHSTSAFLIANIHGFNYPDDVIKEGEKHRETIKQALSDWEGENK